MYMRGKFLLLLLLLMSVSCMSACVRSVESPADELKMYRWSGVSENGTAVDLSFTDNNGYLDIENEDHSLHIGGLCMMKDNSFLIFDEESGMNYSFGYQLYGDRVELNRNGSMIKLEKLDTE